MNTSSTSASPPLPLDPRHFVDVDCYLCGAAERRERFGDGRFRVVECRRCGLVYTTPRLTAAGLEALYQDPYWKSHSAKDYGYMDYLQDRELYLRTFRRRIQVLLRYLRGGRILDVGCAAGFFLHVAREAGFEPYGVDVARPMLRYAREELGLSLVREGSLREARFPEAFFDAVTLWDVVEHMEDPRSELAEVRRILKPDGVLLLETQNVRSLFARLLGRRWQHFKMLEHLYHFDSRTGTELLRQAGFQVVARTSRRAGKYVSLAFVVERTGRLSPWLPRLLRPLNRFGRISLYVNPYDELIFIARPGP